MATKVDSMSINSARRPVLNRAHLNGRHTKLVDVDGAGRHRRDLPAETDGARLEAAARDLLIAIGEDPEREALLDTPARVRKSLEALTEGYWIDPRDVVGDALFDVGYDDIVL